MRNKTRIPLMVLLGFSMLILASCSQRQSRGGITHTRAVSPLKEASLKAVNGQTRQEFSHAMKQPAELFLQGKFASARAGFDALADRYKGTVLTIEAGCWSARCLMGQGYFYEARRQLEHILGRSTDATLRRRILESNALCQYYLKDYSTAIKTYKIIERDYRSSSDGEKNLYYLYKSSKALKFEGDAARYAKNLRARFPQGRFVHLLEEVKRAPSPPTLKPIQASVQPTPSKHYVQCGLFSAKVNADKLFKRLRWNGFKPFTFTQRSKGKTIYVVALGYFETPKKAQRELRRLKKKEFKGVLKP